MNDTNPKMSCVAAESLEEAFLRMARLNCMNKKRIEKRGEMEHEE